MKKARRIEAINGEFGLPEALIQHIQSLLSRKEAAQTSILSKSWYSAWLTRPNLDFDQCDFDGKYSHEGDEEAFWKLAKKTVQRYEELNLKIESFRLSMKGAWLKGVFVQNPTKHYCYSIAKELIVKAMKMGAIDLNFEIQHGSSLFILPQEVLGSENLIRLSVTGCTIDRAVDGKVNCSRLESLSLRNVYMKGDTIGDIISSCPLIEKLSFSSFQPSSKDVSGSRVRELNPFIEFGKQNMGSIVGGPIHMYEFHNLKCVSLGWINIPTSFFCDFSSKFPCLKDLTLQYCFGYKEIKISSHSLECMSFFEHKGLRAKFDVPSIRKFRYSGSRLPSWSFRAASMEWESDISICCRRPSTSWFLRLKKFLTNLADSKIFLSLHIGGIKEKNVDFQGSPKPVVENLTLHSDSTARSALLKCIFLSCRPKFITQDLLPTRDLPPKSRRGRARHNYFLLCLYHELIQVNQNSWTQEPKICGLCDPEEVNVEHFEESLAEWQPLPPRLPWNTMLDAVFDASTSPKNKQKIRFRLRWGQEPSAFK